MMTYVTPTIRSRFTRPQALPWTSQLAFYDASTVVYMWDQHIIRSGSYLVAGWSDFGTNAHKDGNGENDRMWCSRSSDDGATWSAPVSADGIYYASYFHVGSTLYEMGCTAENGGIAIRSSSDDGATWSGITVLFAREATVHYARGAPAVLIKSGVIYIAYQDNAASPPTVPDGYKTCVLTASTAADLTNPANWTISNKLAFTAGHKPSWAVGTPGASWIENNVLEKPDGSICLLSRYYNDAGDQHAVGIQNFNLGTNTLSFSNTTSSAGSQGWVGPYGFGSSQTYVIDDRATSGYYLALHNQGTVDTSIGAAYGDRLTFVLSKSTDLSAWTYVQVLCNDYNNLLNTAADGFYGWQYGQGFIENGTLYLIMRTAWNGANTYHNVNRTTFHRILNIRANL